MLKLSTTHKIENPEIFKVGKTDYTLQYVPPDYSTLDLQNSGEFIISDSWSKSLYVVSKRRRLILRVVSQCGDRGPV